MFEPGSVNESQWEKLVACWKVYSQDSKGSLSEEVFKFFCEKYGSIVLKIPETYDFRNMPYLFWNMLIHYSQTMEISEAIFLRIPTEYVKEHLLFLESKAKKGEDWTDARNFVFISMRDDEYGGMPVDWLRAMCAA
jgi:hypothetical protein